MSTAKPEEVIGYIDNIMKAIGSMRQGDILGLVMEMAVHLAMDDLRQHVQITPTTVHEQRIHSPAFKELAKALHGAGIATPGFGEDEELESASSWRDLSEYSPVTYTTVSMDDDDDLHFPMQDS